MGVWLHVAGRSIPEHERVVHLHSAVVNYDYLSGGRSRLPEIRFVSEMLECDLEVALVHGLPELHRCCVTSHRITFTYPYFHFAFISEFTSVLCSLIAC